MKIRLRVTSKHIRAGQRSKCSLCPIALALMDHFKEELGDGLLDSEGVPWFGAGPGNRTRIYVASTVASVPRLGGFDLSRAAQRFVNAFDTKGKKAVKPATFVLTKAY